MWIATKTYTDLLQKLGDAQGEARALAEQNRAHQVTQDWFRVRITQLEQERAQLLFNYTGVKVSTPSIIERAPESDVARALQAVQGFQDIGDAEARRLGLGWNDDGTLKAKE